MSVLRLRPLLLVVMLVATTAIWLAGCDSDDPQERASTSVSLAGQSADASEDIESTVAEPIKAAKAVITVRVLDATFNPVHTMQRMSEQSPSAPEGDESFYQAYVKIENKGATPIRVDPQDFACAVGNAVVGIEPTWTGPGARSLLKNSSLEFLLTFKAKAGYEPVLLYSPSWYDGTIRVNKASAGSTSTTKGS